MYVPEHGLNNPGGKGSRSNGGSGKPAMSSTQKLAPNSFTTWLEVGSCWLWSAPMSSGELCRSCRRSVPCRAAPRATASSFWLSAERASSPESTPSGPEQRLDEMVASILPTQPKDLQSSGKCNGSDNALNYRDIVVAHWIQDDWNIYFVEVSKMGEIVLNLKYHV